MAVAYVYLAQQEQCTACAVVAPWWPLQPSPISVHFLQCDRYIFAATADQLVCGFLQVPIHTLVMDMSNMSEVREIQSKLPEGAKEVDILVNNAGLALGTSSAQEIDLDVRYYHNVLCAYQVSDLYACQVVCTAFKSGR